MADAMKWVDLTQNDDAGTTAELAKLDWSVEQLEAFAGLIAPLAAADSIAAAFDVLDRAMIPVATRAVSTNPSLRAGNTARRPAQPGGASRRMRAAHECMRAGSALARKSTRSGRPPRLSSAGACTYQVRTPKGRPRLCKMIWTTLTKVGAAPPPCTASRSRRPCQHAAALRRA